MTEDLKRRYIDRIGTLRKELEGLGVQDTDEENLERLSIEDLTELGLALRDQLDRRRRWLENNKPVRSKKIVL